MLRSFINRLILAIFVFAIPASASVSRIGSGTGTTSFTISGTLTSTTLQIGFAFRAGNATAPTLPAGWTNMPTGGTVGTITIAATASVRIGCRISSTAASGTWTNATNVVGVAYGGVPAVTTSANCATFAYALFATGTDGLLECKTAANCTGTGVTTLTWRALANATGDSTAWYAGFVGASAASFCAPTGMTSVATTGDVELYDSNAAVSGFAGSTCPISSENYIQFGVEILAAPSACSGCTPARDTITVTPDVDNGGTTLAANQTIYVPFASPSLSGQNIQVVFSANPAGTTFTATDTAGSAYSQIITCAGSPNTGYHTDMLMAYNVASGITGVTLKASAATTNFQAMAVVSYNNGTPDASACSTNASSTSMPTGSLTTNNANDYVIHYAADGDVVGPSGPFSHGTNTGITWNPGGMTNLSQTNSSALYDGVLSSASTITPSTTQTTAAVSTSIAVAFIPSNQGSAHTGLFKCYAGNHNLENGATGTHAVQIPACGTNPGVSILVDGPATCPSPASYLSTTPTSTITVPPSGCEVDGSSQVFDDAFYIKPTDLNLTSGIFTLTSTISSSGGDRGHYVSVYSGGSTTHFFDVQTVGQGNYAGSTSLTLLSVTPSNACSEITDAGDSHAFDTTESISAPAGGWLANGWFNTVAQNSNTFYYNNNSLVTAPSSSTSSFNITVGFVRNNAVDVQNWAANSMTFNAAGCPASASAPQSLPLLGVGGH